MHLCFVGVESVGLSWQTLQHILYLPKSMAYSCSISVVPVPLLLMTTSNVPLRPCNSLIDLQFELQSCAS